MAATTAAMSSIQFAWCRPLTMTYRPVGVTTPTQFSSIDAAYRIATAAIATITGAFGT